MTLGKHFINDVNDPVLPALRSLLTNDRSLRLIPEKKILYRQLGPNARKVILLSGGGSGHEPAHAGYVGEGMLDVAVAGNIFASPSASQVLAGIEVLEAPLGALLIVKNYTGDKLNFGLAAEKAKAQGRKVDVVFVEDDVSIKGNELVGHRGLAGVCFVHKIAGAAAVNGLELGQVKSIAQKTADSLYTVAASLDKCSVPQRDGQEGLPHDELEYGMGIHNEPGAERAKISPMKQTISKLLGILLQDGREAELKSSKVAVMINNLGGLSVLELHTLADEILHQLSIVIPGIHRVYIGTFITSLDGPGISVTLLKLDSELEPLLDLSTPVHSWPKSALNFSVSEIENQTVAFNSSTQQPKEYGNSSLIVPSSLFKGLVHKILESVKNDEPLITKYDTLAGDGDCGTTLLNGVNALEKASNELDSSNTDLGSIFRLVATTVESAMGGTSGAIYAIFFNAVATAISKTSETDQLKVLQISLKDGLQELCRYTGARVGSRTLMDALIPFVHKFGATGDISEATKASTEGAEKTRTMGAAFGRASYVTQEQLDFEGGIPDPGALGVVSILKGISAASL